MDNATISRPDLRRRAEAGHWLLKLQEDPLSEAQVEAWLKWSADAENLAEFEAQQTLYTSLLENPALRHTGESRYPASFESGRALHVSAGLAAHIRHLWHPARRRLLAAAASVVVALSGGLLLWSSTFGPTMVAAKTYSTGKAIHREVMLPDGSQAVLGARSKLTVAYDGNRRRVIVEAGEVFFEVKKERSRPFVVEAGALSATAVGTAFDVRRNDDHVVVTVAEGRVDVERQAADAAAGPEPSPAQVRAQAGERVTLLAAASALAVTSVSPAAAGNWRHGSLEFAGEPLHVVVANLNRYLVNEITIRDAEVGQWTYSGTVQPAYVNEWLRALEQVFPVRASQAPDGSVTLVRAERTPSKS